MAGKESCNCQTWEALGSTCKSAMLSLRKRWATLSQVLSPAIKKQSKALLFCYEEVITTLANNQTAYLFGSAHRKSPEENFE